MLKVPEWRDGTNKEKGVIRDRFKKIILTMADCNMTSVAILLDDCYTCGWKDKKAIKLLVKMTMFEAVNSKINIHVNYFVTEKDIFETIHDVLDDYFDDVEGIAKTNDREEDSDWEVVHQSKVKGKENLCLKC